MALNSLVTRCYETERDKTRRYETKRGKTLILNNKKYVAPPMDGSDFKELFMQMMAEGAGLPVDSDRIPSGPWTPELLADTMSQINSSGLGADLRTVQHWFEKNDKGISTENIRWLARIFGCGDPNATSAWQAELSASRRRLIAKRRKPASADKGSDRAASSNRDAIPPAQTSTIAIQVTNLRPSGLAEKTETLFSSSPLNMPTAVFACAVALGFMSLFLGNHDLMHSSIGNPSKQVGFIWAPNWTVLFLILMPLFLGTVSELLMFWREKGRHTFRPANAGIADRSAWLHRVKASTYSFWTVFLICFVFAGAMQWIGKRLLPLLNGGGEYATDWGTIAISRPDIISVPTSIAFTGFAYLYMCVCFYLFFAGLVLLYLVVQDMQVAEADAGVIAQVHKAIRTKDRVMQGIFRCTLAGVLIALCMKLQSVYLISSAPDILSWLLSDMASALSQTNSNTYADNFRTPKQFSSLLIVISCCFVFLYGASRMSYGKLRPNTWAKQRAVMTFVVLSYLLVNAFVGFSILLGVGLFIAVYGICNPGFGLDPTFEEGSS